MAEVLSALVTWALILGGALSLTVGLCFFVGTLRFLGRAVPLPGRVAGYEAGRGGPGGLPLRLLPPHT